MTDSAWLLGVLEDGSWHTLSEILRRSDAERGHGLTVHSRVSDLRKQGHQIEQKSWRANGRVQSTYRLVSLASPDTESMTPVDLRQSVSGDASDSELALFEIPAARGAYSETAV